ncbi:MAG: hypothetical protein ACPG4U_10885, partial [Pseudomonadales bacterium]
MRYKRSKSGVFRYLSKRLEMAVGLGLILAVAVLEQWLTPLWAVLAFIAVVALRTPNVLAGYREVRDSELEIQGDTVILHSPEGEQRYPVEHFKVLLYKRRAKAVTVFVVMSEDSGLKIEY